MLVGPRFPCGELINFILGGGAGVQINIEKITSSDGRAPANRVDGALYNWQMFNFDIIADRAKLVKPRRVHQYGHVQRWLIEHLCPDVLEKENFCLGDAFCMKFLEAYDFMLRNELSDDV